MSNHSYSKTSFYRIAEGLSASELGSSAKVAAQAQHSCSGKCFYCVCKELYDRDLAACADLALDLALDSAAKQPHSETHPDLCCCSTCIAEEMRIY